MARGEKAPHPKGTAVETSVWDVAAECIVLKEIGRGLID
jgi:hypothetical protein